MKGDFSLIDTAGDMAPLQGRKALGTNMRCGVIAGIAGVWV
jgi:hypothetical protein